MYSVKLGIRDIQGDEKTVLNSNGLIYQVHFHVVKRHTEVAGLNSQVVPTSQVVIKPV